MVYCHFSPCIDSLLLVTQITWDCTRSLFTVGGYGKVMSVPTKVGARYTCTSGPYKAKLMLFGRVLKGGHVIGSPSICHVIESQST